jgi:23S rRNA-/tRNA-specific pseudouridylate synthase
MTDIDLERIGASFFSRHWVWHLRANEAVAPSCREELCRRLPHIDPGSWDERFALGGAYVAGRQAGPDTVVAAPCKLEYYEPKFPFDSAEQFYPQFCPSWILYQDPDIGVAYKPARLPTTATRDQQRFFLVRYLEKFFAAPVHAPSRLDTAVSGLLLFSLSSRANRWFQKAQERRLIEKYYVCEVSGVIDWDQSTVERALGRDERHPILRRVVASSGEDAVTRLTRLGRYSASSEERTLLQAEPITGRTHQIRVHCQSEGLPIVGDPLYGGAQDAELRLASCAIRFHHPFRNEELVFELPLAHKPGWLQDAERNVGVTQIRYRRKEAR